jgi:hypothetical protein
MYIVQYSICIVRGCSESPEVGIWLDGVINFNFSRYFLTVNAAQCRNNYKFPISFDFAFRASFLIVSFYWLAQVQDKEKIRQLAP